MNTPARYLIAAALLATLAACGNKGPLVQASRADKSVPAVAPPAATDPTDAAPSDEITPPPAADPASATPSASPPAGGGHG